MPTKILIKRGSASQWSSSTTALSSGELGLDTTNNIIKVGDGSTLWNSLPGLTLTLTQVAELAQDALSTAFSNGTHSNIVVTYNDAGDAISLATGPDVITTTSLNNTLTDPSSGYVSIGDVGVADGVASLGPDGKIPDSEIPAGIARDTEVSTAIANLVNSAPATLDTLNELATALGNDANFSTTVTNSIAGKVSKSGGDTITASTASTVGLIIKGATSQTANLLEFKDSSGAVVGKYNSSYQMTVGSLQAAVGDVQARYGIYGGGTGYLGALSIVSWAANVPTAVLRGYASQTANLQEWQDSSGNVLSKIDSFGAFKTASTASFGTISGGGVWGGYSPVVEIRNPSSSTSAINIFAAGGPAIRVYDGSGYQRGAWNQDGSIVVGQSNTKLATLSVYADSAATIGAVIRRVTSQTADLMQWQDQNGGILGTINKDGAITLNSSTSLGAALNAYTSWSGATGIIVKGSASQTANLQEWQNSAGTVLAAIDPNGQIRTPQILNIASFNNSRLQMTSTGSLFDVGVASNVALRVRGAASQTANLQEWQNSAGTVLASIYPTGFINTASGIGANTTSYMNGIDDVTATKMSLRFNSTSYGLQLTNIQAGAVGYIVKGAASQTADLQQWQNSSGTVLAQIDVAGNSVFNNISTTNNINAYYGKISANTQGSGFLGQISAIATSASTIGMVIRGAASQTANLQEWQNSAGTILAKVDSAGSINAVGLSLTSTVSGTMFSVDPTYGGIKSRGGAVGFTGAASLNIGTNYTGQSAIVASGFAGQSVSTVIIKSVASQTSNLTEWQDSSGTVLAKVTSDGSFTSYNTNFFGRTFFLQDGSTNASTQASGAYFAASSANSAIYARTTSASIVPLVVQGTTSQTADLQQWQNSSGTVLVKLTAEGVLDTPLITNAQAASYTLVAADSGKLVEINNASGVTLTIPTNASVSYAIGTQINILQTGTGQITIAGAGGVTVNATPGLKLRAQWSSATLIKRGTDTWVAIGDLSV